MTNLLKNWRILFWIFFILLSIYSIGPKFDTTGLEVNYVNPESPLAAIISEGTIIYEINEQAVTQELLNQNYTQVKLSTNQGDKFFVLNGSLGLETKEVSSNNLNFGLDIKGGTRTIIKPVFTNETKQEKEDMAQQIISTLQTRINVYGLQETTFRPLWDGDELYIQIEISGGSKEQLTQLLEQQGMFEARIPLEIIDNQIHFDDQYFDVSEEEFTVDDIDFIKTNETTVEAIVYIGENILNIYIDPQHSWMKQAGEGYEWGFQVLINQEGSDKFDKVIQNIPVVTIPGQSSYLEQPIKFFLDGKIMDELRISSALKTSSTNTPAITGYGETLEIASDNRLQLQSILRSGSLPTEITIEQMDVISPKLGSGFLGSMATAGLFSILAVSIVVFVRYRKIKLVLPMIFVSLSEVLIILGASVFIGWTIDLAALAGILAAVGTGVDSQIMIMDETIEGKSNWTMKEKLKRAFFMIFGAAGTTIGAMIPLMVLGFGLLRGFAITTSVGVLIGAFVTRPAFGKIVEKIIK